PYPDILVQDAVDMATFLSVVALTCWMKRQGERLARHARLGEAHRRVGGNHQGMGGAEDRSQADPGGAPRGRGSAGAPPAAGAPGHELAMAHRFARQVGGDLIDVRRRGGRLAICVADVSGKGAQAALMAVAIRGWLDLLPTRYRSPAQVADWLNHRLCDCVPVEMFVTLAYVLMEIRTGTARYIAAGHEPFL